MIYIGQEARCVRCRDTQWIRYNVPLGTSQWGDLFRCPDCSSLTEDQKKRIAGIPERQNNQSFETFKPAWNPTAQIAYNTCKDYAAGMHVPWLVLSGGYGTGKTHLIRAIALSLISRNCSVRIWYIPTLLDFFKMGINAKEDHSSLVTVVNAVETLILDDLGVEYSTDYTESLLEKVLKIRYESEKKTVITTNLILLNMPGHLRSLFSDKQICHWLDMQKGKDYRAQ